MRPSKMILLVCEDEEARRHFSYILSFHRPHYQAGYYAVLDAPDAATALVELGSLGFELMICLYPVCGVTALIPKVKAVAPFMPIMVLSKRDQYVATHTANDWLCDASTAYILDRIKIMTARKRGPKKGTPSPRKGIPMSERKAIA